MEALSTAGSSWYDVNGNDVLAMRTSFLCNVHFLISHKTHNIVKNVGMLELPPIPEEVVQLVTVDSPVGPDLDKKLQQTKAIYAELQKFCEFYRQKSEEHRSCTELPDKELKYENRALKYANGKLVKLIKKHMLLSREIYTKIYGTLTVTAYFMERAISLRFPVTFDLDGIKPLVITMFKENRAFQTVSMRVKSLQAYIQAKSEEKQIKPTLDDCVAVLTKCAESVNASFGYSYETIFDRIFLEYLWECGAMERVDEVARELSVHVPPSEPRESEPQHKIKLALTEECPPFVLHKPPKPVLPKGFLKWPNLVPLERFYYEMMETLKVRTLAQECILRCALIRIVFDRLYLMDRMLDKSNEEMKEGLTMVRRLLVSDMNVSLSLFDDCNIEIGDLATANQLAREVSSFMESVNLVTNTLDLAEAIYIVSQTIGSMRRTSDPNAEMCFDDFFALFVVLFSASPPVNSCGIAELLDVYSTICIPESLKHSSTSFCAWVGYIKKFMSEDHPEKIRDRIAQVKQNL